MCRLRCASQAGDQISDPRWSHQACCPSVLLARVNSRDANGMPPSAQEIDSSGVIADRLDQLAQQLP
jgi:hypothetical protein